MKGGIIINGNWGGFKYDLGSTNEFPESEKAHIGYDCTKASPLALAIGQQCYAISFSPSGRVFTIYRVVKDYIRNKSTGFLSISLFLPFGKNLSGEKIKGLLDESMSQSLEFIPDNNLGAVNINWSFVEGVLSKYNIIDNNPSNHVGIWNSGLDAAAYIYCNDEHLIQYFNDPYHDQFKQFRQVLFIDEKKPREINILQAFKHSRELTEEIDILNPDFYFVFNKNNGIEIDITAEDRRIHNTEKVKKGQKVKIRFSKKHYISKDIKEGTCLELSRDNPNLISIDALHNVTVSTSELVPELKELKLEIKAGNKHIPDSDIVSIVIKNHEYGQKIIKKQSERIIFKGDEIGCEWSIIIDFRGKFENKIDHFFPNEKNKVIHVAVNRTKISTTNPEGFREPKISLKGVLIFSLIGLGIFIALGYFLLNLLRPNTIPDSHSDSDPATVSNNSKLLKDVTVYTEGTDLIKDSLINYRNQLSILPPDSNLLLAISTVDNGIKIRETLEGNNATAISVIIKNDKLSIKQKSIFANVSTNDINYLIKIPDRKNLSLTDIKDKLDSIINSSKANKPDKRDIDFSDGNGVNQPSTNTKEKEKGDTPKKARENITENSNVNTSENNKANKKYNNVEFQHKIINFKTPHEFNQLDDQKLTDEQKLLRNIIKLHLTEINDGKYNWFKRSTSWPKFKEEVLKLN